MLISFNWTYQWISWNWTLNDIDISNFQNSSRLKSIFAYCMLLTCTFLQTLQHLSRFIKNLSTRWSVPNARTFSELYSTELCHAFQFSKPIDLAIFMRWPGILGESGREKERPQAVKVQVPNELHQFVEVCLKCLCKSDATSSSEFSKISCLPAASRSCLRKSV